MINNKEEYIICSAVHFKDDETYIYQPINIQTGYVVTGRRHYNCFYTNFLLVNKIKSPETVQGFLTSHNRFSNSQEALELAKQKGQVNKDLEDKLLSEDLY